MVIQFFELMFPSVLLVGPRSHGRSTQLDPYFHYQSTHHRINVVVQSTSTIGSAETIVKPWPGDLKFITRERVHQ